MSPIHSVKHVVDSSGGLTSTRSVNTIAQTVESLSTPFNPIEVELGATVNGIFLIVNIIGATGAGVTGPVDWYIIKKRTGQGQAALPDPGQTGVSPFRSQIIHEEKGVPGSADGTPHVFKGVIVVPKGMRRMRDEDTFEVVLKMTDPDTGVFCVKAIYKSFS